VLRGRAVGIEGDWGFGLGGWGLWLWKGLARVEGLWVQMVLLRLLRLTGMLDLL